MDAITDQERLNRGHDQHVKELVQTTLFPEPPREQQLELGLDVPEKTPEDMFLEDAVAFLDLQAQVAEARGAKKLAQKLFKTRQQLGNRERN